RSALAGLTAGVAARPRSAAPAAIAAVDDVDLPQDGAAQRAVDLAAHARDLELAGARHVEGGRRLAVQHRQVDARAAPLVVGLVSLEDVGAGRDRPAGEDAHVGVEPDEQALERLR